MARETPEQFTDRLLRRLSRTAFSHARPLVTEASGELGRYLSIKKGEDRQSIALHIPHFWAVYVDQGTRRAIRPIPPKRWLVWFPNPEDDPRLDPYPIRREDVKSLLDVWTDEEWTAAKRVNRERARAGLLPIFYFSKFEPARRGKHFFGRGMKPWEDRVDRLVVVELEKFVSSNAISEKITAEFRLGRA